MKQHIFNAKTEKLQGFLAFYAKISRNFQKQILKKKLSKI